MLINKITVNYCCMDCGNLISKPTAFKGQGRCMSCSRKGELSWMLGKKFIRNPRRHQKYFCKENLCQNEISYECYYNGTGYCNIHKQLGKRNHQFGKRGILCHHTTYQNEIEAIINNKIIGSMKWSEFRKIILERDNYKCQICGATATEIHHKKPRKDYPELCWKKSNTIAICKSCHTKITPKRKINIIQLNLNNKFIKKWSSIQEAQNYFNPNTANIWFTLHNIKNQKTAYGFIWKRTEDYYKKEG